MRNRVVLGIVVLAIIAVGLAFTKPGHTLLSYVGISGACSPWDPRC